MPQRYQRGSLRCTKRKAGPDRWEYLWRENDETGMRVRRTTVIGTVEQYPTRDLAQATVNGLRMQVNEDRLRHPGGDIDQDLTAQSVTFRIVSGLPTNRKLTELLFQFHSATFP